MAEFTPETIEVAAVFGKNRIRPKWFLRGSAKHDIKEVSYIWRSRLGGLRSEVFEVAYLDSAKSS